MWPCTRLFLLFSITCFFGPTSAEILWIKPSVRWVQNLIAHSNYVFASSSTIGTIQQWDLQERRFVKTIGSHYPGGPLAVSTDGRFLVSEEGSFRHLWVWGLADGSAHRITDGLYRPQFLGFHAGANRLSILTGLGDIHTWDISTQSFTGPVRTLPGISDLSNPRVIPSRDGVHAGVIVNGQLRVINLNTLASEAIATADEVFFAAFSADGEKVALVTRFSNATLRVWNRQSGQFQNSFQLPSAAQPLFSPNGEVVVIIENEMTIFNLEKNLERKIPVPGRSVPEGTPFAFSGDGQILIVGSSIVDQQTGQWTELIPAEWTVHNLAFSPDGSQLVTLENDVGFRDARTGEKLARPLSRQSIMRMNAPIRFNADGTQVLVGGSIFDTATRAFISNLPRNATVYGAVDALGPDSYFVAELNQYAVQSLNYSDGSLLQSFAAPKTSGSSAVAVSHSGHIVAGGGGYIAPADDFHNHRLHLWNALDGQLLASMPNEQRFPFKIAFSPDDTYLVSAAEQAGAELNIFHIPTRRPLFSLRKQYAPALGFDFLPDNRTLVFGHQNGLEFWDLPSSNLVTTIQDEAHVVTALAVSPDGKQIAVARWDGTLVMYRSPTISSLKITTSPGNYTLQFDTTTGTTYTLESSTDLTTWKPLATFTGSGAPIQHTVAPAETIFYRLR